MGNDSVNFGIFTPPRELNWIYQTANLAEKLGNYDSVWMADHLSWGTTPDALDAWTVMTAAGLQTKSIKVGIGVTDPHRRHPAVLAQTTMTMERVIGDGRVIMGIGAGESMNLDAYGISWDRPVSRMREFLEVYKRLQKKKSLRKYHGEFYQLRNAAISPRPKNIPVFVAGNRPKTRKITGELADGWIPFKVNPAGYRGDLAEVFAAASNAGRDPFEISPGILLYTAVSDSTDVAKGYIEKIGKVLLMVSPNKLKELGYDPPTEALDATKHHDRGKMIEGFNKIDEIPSEALDEVFVYGTPDECIGKIEKFIQAGCRYFVIGLLNPGKEREEGITTYSKKIISYFK